MLQDDRYFERVMVDKIVAFKPSEITRGNVNKRKSRL